MASNELSPRASVASSSEMSLADPATAGKLLPKKDKSSGPLKLKKSIAKKTKPKDGESAASVATRSPSPSSPTPNDIDPDSKSSSLPSGRPIEDRPDMILCNHCKKPMVSSVLASHIKICEQKKKERAKKKKEAKEAKEASQRAKVEAGASGGKPSDDTTKTKDKDTDKDKEGGAHMPDDPASVTVSRSEEPTRIKSAKKSSASKATPASDIPKKSKKRKADADGQGEKEPKKKKAKKDEPPKPKLPKPKGPVDVEKQCGVLLPNGGFCARSLTCKSHSMGAKRAVPGRSLPYDILLAQYQKKNQAKQQKAAISANAPLLDDIDSHGPIDSDEEKDTVMAAIARSRPRPLEQHVHIETRRKYQVVRIRDVVGGMFGRSGPGGMFSRAGGGENVVEGEGAERRGSAVAGAGAGNKTVGAGHVQRKPSVGGAASVS